MIGRSAGRVPGSPREPRTVLSALRTAPYTWDLSSDALAWGPSFIDLVGTAASAALCSGRAFAAACGAGGEAWWPQGRDLGSGVAYRVSRSLHLPDGRGLSVEDAGRWFAGPDGAAALARGTLRCEAARGEAADASARLACAIAADLRLTVTEGRSATLLLVACDAGPDEAEPPAPTTITTRLRTGLRRHDRLIAGGAGAVAVWLDACGPDRAAAAAARLRGALGDLAMARVGGACVPVHALDAITLVRRAEAALALADDRCPVRLFAPAAAPRRRGASAPDLAILEALNARRVELVGRPVVAASSREAAWLRVRAGLAAPDGPRAIVSVPADLAPLLDARALELAADHLAATPTARLALPLHAVTLADPDWLPALAAHCRVRPGIAPRLSVSLREADLALGPAAARQAMGEMRALGLGVALHDVGGGDLSVAEIAALPVDALAVDGVFVEVAGRSPDDRLHLRTLVALAHRLGLLVAAPWVEDEEAARALAALGFDHLEGALTGSLAPLPRIAVSGGASPRAKRA